MVRRLNLGQTRPIQPTAGNLKDVDAFFPALTQHPAEGGPKRLCGAIQGLEIDKANAFQPKSAVILSVENRTRGQPGAFGNCQDRGALAQQRSLKVPLKSFSRAIGKQNVVVLVFQVLPKVIKAAIEISAQLDFGSRADRHPIPETVPAE